MAARRRIRTWLAPLLAAVAIAAVAAAGCGGGDDTQAAADMPEPRTYQAFATHVAQLLAEAEDRKDCKRLEQIDRRSPAELPCPAPEALRERMDSFEVRDRGLYMDDRVAVIDYQPGAAGEDTAMVLLLDYDRRWAVVQLDIDADQPPGNAPGDGDTDIRRAVWRYERAVRKRDCKKLTQATYRPPGAPPADCDDQLAETAKLAEVLNSDPAQRPAFNGGSEDFGFYSLTAYLPGATHHTFVVIGAEVAGNKRFFVTDVIKDR